MFANLHLWGILVFALAWMFSLWAEFTLFQAFRQPHHRSLRWYMLFCLVRDCAMPVLIFCPWHAYFYGFWNSEIIELGFVAWLVGHAYRLLTGRKSHRICYLPFVIQSGLSCYLLSVTWFTPVLLTWLNWSLIVSAGGLLVSLIFYVHLQHLRVSAAVSVIIAGIAAPPILWYGVRYYLLAGPLAQALALSLLLWIAKGSGNSSHTVQSGLVRPRAAR